MLSAVLVLATAIAAGQITTGTLTGRVTDPQGLVVPGATVTVTNDAQGTRLPPVVTGDGGQYVVPIVAAGTYTIAAEMPGFLIATKAGVALSGGDRVVV